MSAFHTLMPQECVCVCVCGGGGGGGGTLIFSYIYVGWDHSWGFKILNFNIFGGFQKYHYFRGMKILWIYHYKTGLVLGVISIHFRFFFLRSMCRMGILFGVAQNYKYFFGVWLIFPIYFWGRQ